MTLFNVVTFWAWLQTRWLRWIWIAELPYVAISCTAYPVTVTMLHSHVSVSHIISRMAEAPFNLSLYQPGKPVCTFKAYDLYATSSLLARKQQVWQSPLQEQTTLDTLNRRFFSNGYKLPRWRLTESHSGSAHPSQEFQYKHVPLHCISLLKCKTQTPPHFIVWNAPLIQHHTHPTLCTLGLLSVAVEQNVLIVRSTAHFVISACLRDRKGKGLTQKADVFTSPFVSRLCEKRTRSLS